LGDGESPSAIAKSLGVGRRTIYYWIERFQDHDDMNLISRISDSPRSGRPPTALGIIDPLIDKIFDSNPHSFGYRYPGWTRELFPKSVNRRSEHLK
jgi:hypothetical protein